MSPAERLSRCTTATGRCLETAWGPAEQQPPLSALRRWLNDFQQGESLVRETPEETASSCRCKGGNQGAHSVTAATGNCQQLRGWHPVAAKEKKAVEYLLPCVARTLQSPESPLSTALPWSSSSARPPAPPKDTGEPCQAPSGCLAAWCGSVELHCGRKLCLGAGLTL